MIVLLVLTEAFVKHYGDSIIDITYREQVKESNDMFKLAIYVKLLGGPKLPGKKVFRGS